MAITYFERPLNHEVYSLESGLAIVQNGDTASVAITAGHYIFLKNHSTLPNGGYHATANIAVGTTISSSNVFADENGIINKLATTINNDLSNKINTSAIANNLTTTESGHVLDARQGKALNDKIRTITFGSVTGTTSSNANLGLGHANDYIISAWCSDVTGTLVTLERENGTGWWAHCVSDSASPSPKTNTRLTINFYYIS